MTSKWTNPETGTTWELWEGKLPKGWRSRIPGHCEATERNGNGKKSPTYFSWYNMVTRCFLKKENSHGNDRDYYLKGIRVCHRWVYGDGVKHGFLCFLEDMGERPAGTTIDRMDPNGHYTPDNCRWADVKTQARNKRRKKAA